MTSGKAQRVAVLYAQQRGVYHRVDGVDVYDLDNDARDYYGPHPVVAHPPCAQWCRLSGMAKPRLEIAKYLAFHALECLEAFGGVLEHPAHSKFWAAAGLPLPGESDERGCSIAVKLTWFDGAVDKPTWLFVGGMDHSELPEIPFSLALPTHCVDTSSRHARRMKLMSKRKREATPRAMAEWLVDVARTSGRANSRCIHQEAAS